MDNTWFSKIEPRVFTRFEHRLHQKYHDVSCTTDRQKVEKRNFPVVYVHELEQVETGNDLTNETVNAVISTFEIQVYTKKSAENKEIMTEAVLQMKRLRFNVVAMPIYTSESDRTLFYSVARFRRVIGGGDLDITPQA